MAFGLLLAACGEGVQEQGAGTGDTATSDTEPSTATSSSSTTTAPPPTGVGDLPHGLTRCDADAPRFAADPSFYRDTPVYVGNEQPTEEVRAWAVSQPGFEELWIDRDHNGWITLGFSGSADIDALQSELEAEFGDAGVVAVLVPFTNAELEEVRAEASAAVEGLSNWAISHSVSRGLVELSVPVLSEEILEPLAPLAGEPLCVEGADPAVAVADGPQPTEGDGWRLLGEGLTGPAYRTGLATADEQLQALWGEAGLDGQPPDVDWETELAIWFGAVYGSSCPIRMDDVVFDSTSPSGVPVVHAAFVNPGNPVVCTSDANPHAFVVAVERARLPAAPFALQLDADDPPSGAPEERTTVLVDVRPAGAEVEADDLEVVTLGDPGADPGPPTFTPDEVIEVGFPWEFRLDLTCGIEFLGPLNSVMWRRVDPVDGSSASVPPAPWQQAADDGDVHPIAEFLLEATDGRQPHLTITIAEHPVEFEPVPAAEATGLGDQPACR